MAIENMTLADLGGDLKVRLANAIHQEAVAKAKYRQSGLIMSANYLDERANQSGNVTGVKFLNALEGDSDVASEDLSEHIDADGMTGGELLAVRQARAKAWAAADLTSLVYGQDLFGAITQKAGDWAARDEQKRVGAYLTGAAAAVASNNKMTFEIDGKLSASGLISAAQTKGENKDQLQILIVHSAVHAELARDNLVEYRPNSEQDIGFGVYNGYTLVISDTLGATGGVYTSLLAARGAFMIGEGNVAKGKVAVTSSETAGNGWGGDTLIYRRNQIFCLGGFSFKGSITASGGPTNAQLATGSNHELKYDAANVPVVFIKSELTNPEPAPAPVAGS